MGKKVKKIPKAQNFQKRKEEDAEESPFASIVLKEKKEEEKPKAKAKRPSEVVGGYDPKASFADILSNYERTGNPYAMPKKGSSAKTATSFADILDKWEGKDKKKEVKEDEREKSSYKATKSFAEILSEYEGKPVEEEEKAVGKKKEEKIENIENPMNSNQEKSSYKATKSFADILDEFDGVKKPKESVIDEEIEVVLEKKVEEKIEETSLFKKEGEEDWEKRNPEASWSIYGNNESFERKEEKVEEFKEIEEVKEEAKVEEKKSTYTATKDFGEILKGFYEEEIKDTESVVVEIEKAKEEVSFFKKEAEGEIRSPEAAWSIYGNNEEKKTEQNMTDKKPKFEKKPRKGKKEFSKASDGHEKKEVKTFEEIIREKGDVPQKREYTISQLRTMMPQATLDLHGMIQSEAEDEVRAFLSDCRSHGIRKISIITGKGLHSEGGQAVLRDAIIKLLDEDGGISERGSAPYNYGGSGALWIILKKN